jgi:peptidoglycan/LPS O-acetylase OafA/YrhL
MSNYLSDFLVKHLARKTTSSGFIPVVDGFRFFAIFTVVVFHFNTALSKVLGTDWKFILGVANPLETGWWIVRLDLGVKVFFVISGFILALPFWSYYFNKTTPVNLKQYFIRRLYRLEPPYIIAMTGFFLVHIILLKAPIYDYFIRLIAGIFYAHNLTYGINNPINPVSWSLETEAQFYILLPVLASLLLRIKNRFSQIILLAAIAVIAIIAKNWLMNSSIKYISHFIGVYLINFWIGLCIARFYIQYKQWFYTSNYYWDFIHAISIFLLFVSYKPQADISNIIFFNISLIVYFISGFKGKWSHACYSSPLIYIIGGMCYSIYLLHLPFFMLIIPIIKKFIFYNSYGMNLLAYLFISCILLLVISTVYFLFVERPFMKIQKIK